MRHSTQELIELIYRFYPNGVCSADPRFNDTEESRRRLDAQRRAADAAEVERFRALLDRLKARIPGSSIHEMLYLIPKLMYAWDACFPATLFLPTVPQQEGSHALLMNVSILAPYYIIHSSLSFYVKGGNAKHIRSSFALSPVEQPYARVIADEIEATYGYEPLPPEIGRTLVPISDPEQRCFGESTIFECLFTKGIY